MHKIFRPLRTEWTRVYAHTGGISGLIRCLWTTGLIYTGIYSRGASHKIDCVVITVLPSMAVTWASFMQPVLAPFSSRLFIGDVSGILSLKAEGSTSIRVLPIFNFTHGTKLDLLMHKVCRAEYVVVSDDDIFWLDPTALQWAIDHLERDAEVGVVSLRPQAPTHSLIGMVDQRMSVGAIVVRRALWVREHLSFKTNHELARKQGYTWFYDTGDLANIQLLERSHKIIFAPPGIQDMLVEFSSITSWALKVQSRNGDIRSNIVNHPGYQERALRALIFIQYLNDICQKYFNDVPHLNTINPEYLEKAVATCTELIGSDQAQSIVEDTRQTCYLLGQRLQVLTNAR